HAQAQTLPVDQRGDVAPPPAPTAPQPPTIPQPSPTVPPANTGSEPAPTAVAPGGAPPVATTQPAPAPPAPSANHQSLGFLSRFLDGYTSEYAYAPRHPAPARRSMPDALDSPPFPAAHWSLNGTPDIGVPDTAMYAFMDLAM
ncbi:MAG TPA: hypothetical protein VEN29_18340, partial [Casimicrobiaceae bacterium]|nr:hypothetical protein [Casimicrobiaceae bacterium]